MTDLAPYPDHAKDDTMTTDDLTGQITALLTGWVLPQGRMVSRREAQTMASALVKLWPDTQQREALDAAALDLRVAIGASGLPAKQVTGYVRLVLDGNPAERMVAARITALIDAAMEVESPD